MPAKRAGRRCPAATAELAKLSAPALLNVCPRPRLFRGLDGARRRPLVWIAAPAGAGKTTLAASYLAARRLRHLWYRLDARDADPASFFYYLRLALQRLAPRKHETLPLLTPEYYAGLAVFTRNFFEAVGTRLKPPAAIVLDNYQDVPDDAPLHALLPEAVAALPPGATLLVLSRTEPPPACARLRAHGEIARLGWEDMRLLRDELPAFARAHRSGAIGGERLDRLHAFTGGWAAGVRLLLERDGTHETGPLARESLFEYFAAEILERAEPAAREFLFATALLPQITASAAEALTGHRGAARRLADLARRNFFTARRAGEEATYEYHPLFREFLLHAGEGHHGHDGWIALKRRAAALMVAGGQFENAARLMHEAGDDAGLAGLIASHAETLAAQGRLATLERWLRALPAETLERSGWLSYWLGGCLLPADPAEARGHYERAYRLMAGAGDVAGLYLAWAGIAESFIYLWGDFSGMRPWLAELAGLQRRHPQFPSTQIEARVIHGAFSTLYYVDPANPLVEPYRRRVEALMREVPDPNFKCQAANNLVLYYAWYGSAEDQRRVAAYIAAFADHPATTPLARILARLAQACPEWMCGEAERAHALCDEGLRIAEQSGVHMLDLFLLAYRVYASGIHAEVAAMGSLLERMRDRLSPQRPLDGVHYNHQMTWYLSLCRRYDEALAHGRAAAVAGELSAVSPAGFVHVSTAQALTLAGRLDEAATHLDQAAEIARRHDCLLVHQQCSIMRAALALRRGSEDECVRELRPALRLVVQLGYWIYVYWHPDIASELCAIALRHGIETDYVRRVIRTVPLAPPPGAINAADWPFPVKVYTLGRFEVRIEDAPLMGGGRGHRKPLELLKALIALGGRSVAEDTLSALLWPEAEGDAAARLFKVTLHRLRRLLGRQGALELREGKLGLNPREVWLDTWALEQGLAAAEAQPDPARRAETLERALSLHQGAFLAHEPETHAPLLRARERIKERALRAIKALLPRLGGQGACAQLVALCERAIDLDALQEDVHQCLLRCHLAQGQRAEALATAARAERAFSALALEPSDKLKALKAQALGHSPLPGACLHCGRPAGN